jgi:hypothetical protein
MRLLCKGPARPLRGLGWLRGRRWLRPVRLGRRGAARRRSPLSRRPWCGSGPVRPFPEWMVTVNAASDAGGPFRSVRDCPSASTGGVPADFRRSERAAASQWTALGSGPSHIPGSPHSAWSGGASWLTSGGQRSQLAPADARSSGVSQDMRPTAATAGQPRTASRPPLLPSRPDTSHRRSGRWRQPNRAVPATAGQPRTAPNPLPLPKPH